MRTFAQTILFCAAVATELRMFENIGLTDDGQVIHRVQSQEECDHIFEDGTHVFN